LLERPDLQDDAIISCLRASYGISVAVLTFLPIGADSSAWAYRAHTADGRTYFLKVRKGPLNEPSLTVPRYLQDQGVARVVAPLLTTAQAVWAGLGDFKLILYPFIDGQAGRDVGLEEHHWITYGSIFRQIHATVLPPDLVRRMRKETFTPEWGEMVAQLDAHITRRRFDDPIERELAGFWRARRAEIRTLMDRAEVLGQRLEATAAPWVLCHADAHTANVLVDRADSLWVVDWDEVVLAPKERDLMFVVGGISSVLVGPREEELFFEGYGPAAVNPIALAYYRTAWAIGDIGGFGEEVFFMPELGVESKRLALRRFLSLFRPGEIVSLAFGSRGYE